MISRDFPPSGPLLLCMQQSGRGMKVIELKEGVVVKDLVVRVSRRWNIRSILNVNEEFSDDGPLKEEKTKVFNVLVRDETNPDDQSELMLFFYDLWAEKCFFIQNGDKITISGAHEMVHMSNGDLHDFPLCLVFTQDVISQVTQFSYPLIN